MVKPNPVANLAAKRASIFGFPIKAFYYSM
jgi:hypothetical protein